MTSNEAQLAAWFQRLVALLQAGGGALAQQLVAAVSGRGALLVLDDARLALDASVGEAGTLELRIVAAESERPATCATTGETLRAIVDGRRLLDAVVADGSLDLRAPLPALLGFHELVLMAIAHGPRSAGLRRLWNEFDESWPRTEAPSCAAIGRQAADHGGLRRFVPEVVQRARSPLADSRSDFDAP